MTQDDERLRFSERFKQALADARIKPTADTVAELINRRAPIAAVTASAARKWLTGLAIPSQNRLQILADILDVKAAWLRFGDCDIQYGKDAPQAALTLLSFERLLVEDFRALTAPSQDLMLNLLNLLLRHENQK